MKIKWINGERLIPSVGILKNGDVREIADQDAKDLIRQGLAMAYTKPRVKKRIIKNKEE